MQKPSQSRNAQTEYLFMLLRETAFVPRPADYQALA